MEEPAQPGRSARRISPSRRAVSWLASWAVLTGLGLLVHFLAWKIGAGSPRPALLHSAGNALHVLTAPGWAVVRVTFGGWSVSSWAGPATAIGIGCAVWVAGVWAYLALRGRTRRTGGKATGPNPARRRFLTDAPAAAAGLTGAGLLVQSAFVEPWALTIRSYRIPIDGLPSALDGLRLVQISDTHLGPRIPASFIRSAVDRALALAPDIFLLTGDYIHNGAAYIVPAAELFRPLVAAGRPVVGVLGNHDWYGGGREMSRALAAIGVRMIDNGRVWLDAGSRTAVPDPPDQALCIAGVGDLMQDTVDPDAALGGVPDPVPRLLLSHNPDAAELRIGHRVDLMISGHTHGGQVRLPLIGTPIVPSRYGSKYAGGLVRGPAFPVLISRGVGMSILPVRLGVPPELVEITLTRA